MVNLRKWDEARQIKGSMVKFIEKLIPEYDYSDPERAEVTDEKFCEYMTLSIREIKDILFNLIQTGFESHKQLLEKDLEKVRDELDILSDEIKAKKFKWDKGISLDWLERLISYDFELIRSVHKMRQTLNELFEKFHKAEKPDSKLFDKEKWNDMKKTTGLLYKISENIAVQFKERESICNIRNVSFEKTFSSIRDRLRKGF